MSETGFGATKDGAARLLTLETPQLRVQVTDYGARMVAIAMRDGGGFADVLLGLDDAGRYAAAGGSFGAVLGRCANRIGGAAFTLDGKRHELAAQTPGVTLHGGPRGFGVQPWTVVEASARHVRLRLVSPDGDQGFPGTLTAQATYTVEGEALLLELEATTEAPTVVNLSAHPYFNLAGVDRHDVLGHEVRLRASRFVPTDARQIPEGPLRDVAGTPFDFRQARTLGERIRRDDPQLRPGRGYDTCFVLDPDDGGPAATVRDPASGRRHDLFTDQPGLQLYSGNSLDGAVIGRGGIAFRQSAGVALEAQNFPDAPNRPDFPSAVLRPGERYARYIRYRFHTG